MRAHIHTAGFGVRECELLLGRHSAYLYTLVLLSRFVMKVQRWGLYAMHSHRWMKLLHTKTTSVKSFPSGQKKKRLSIFISALERSPPCSSPLWSKMYELTWKMAAKTNTDLANVLYLIVHIEIVQNEKSLILQKVHNIINLKYYGKLIHIWKVYRVTVAFSVLQSSLNSWTLRKHTYH